MRFRAEVAEKLAAHERSLDLLLRAVAPHLQKVILARLPVAQKGMERIEGPIGLCRIWEMRPHSLPHMPRWGYLGFCPYVSLSLH